MKNLSTSNFKSFRELFLHYHSHLQEGQSIAKQYKTEVESYNNLVKAHDEYAEALELLKEVIDEESSNFIETIENILTLAVKKVFDDVKDPKVEILIKGGAKTSAEVYYQYVNEDNNVVYANVKNGVGGGVKAVISFVLQTFIITYSNKSRIIIADEPFLAISKNYRENFMQFLNELSLNHKFKFLFITHDEDIVENSETVYRMVDGELTKIRG